ncbi:MAG: endonuclease MutS2 [Oscillospiraceae bacterium]|nr:endonuclease MutS2 [Oscillospiraceae bacterium]
MTLCEKSLKLLELPDILDLLAGETASAAAADEAKELRPACDLSTAQTRIFETTAAKNMMVLKQSPPFSGVKDIRAIVRRADIGGLLNTKELLDIAEVLRAASSSISYFKNGKTDLPSAIDYLFLSLSSNKPLQNTISETIISEDEISDNASKTLRDIRRSIRLTEEKIRADLNKIITSQTYAKVLQEAIITIRNNRYVVPVKAEHKHSLPGMVHDISSSGATHFIEPMSVVNMNNTLRELASEESDEIERILMELSASVADAGDSIISDFEILAKLDFIFAKAKLSYKMNASPPELVSCAPSPLSEKNKAESVSRDQTGIIRLIKARHPLLPKSDAVAINIHVGGDFDTLIITGPNTGGKTVALKTLGLLCAMASCGLHIPADHGSIVPIFGSILADIGDEQSIEQSLSTFSSHMTNIIAILEACQFDSLLLFDELGAGTDPVEGAALAMSIIEYARKTKALVAATTHYPELKSYALTSDGIMNASCEFDIETLKPTYKLIIGIPGKSNAFAISKRLGLPDKIINDAKARISTENVSFEDALKGLEQTRVMLENERNETALLLAQAKTEMQKASEARAKLEKEQDIQIGKAKREAADIIKNARNTVESVIEEINTLHRSALSNTYSENSNEDKAKLLGKLNKAADAALATDEKSLDTTPPEQTIVPGDKVKIRGIDTLADVISVDSGILTLQAGIMKVTIEANRVVLAEDAKKAPANIHGSSNRREPRHAAAKNELDMRGMNVDEALPVMDQFIDNAIMAKLNLVTIIHGKGTGVLRKAVHSSLKKDGQRIKSFRLGLYGEGENGVTIVQL